MCYLNQQVTCSILEIMISMPNSELGKSSFDSSDFLYDDFQIPTTNFIDLTLSSSMLGYYHLFCQFCSTTATTGLFIFCMMNCFSPEALKLGSAKGPQGVHTNMKELDIFCSLNK